MLEVASHELWMRQALAFAKQAAESGEVPVGAVLVSAEGELLGTGYNHPIAAHDPSAHAEMLAIRAAAQKISNYRLSGSTLYVTLEPCLMCMGALLHARVAHLVFAARDPKVGSSNLLQHELATHVNHRVECTSGILELEASTLLKKFFENRR